MVWYGSMRGSGIRFSSSLCLLSMIKWGVFWFWIRVLNGHCKLSSHLSFAPRTLDNHNHNHPRPPTVVKLPPYPTISLTRRAAHLPLLATPQPNLGAIPSRRRECELVPREEVREDVCSRRRLFRYMRALRVCSDRRCSRQ